MVSPQEPLNLTFVCYTPTFRRNNTPPASRRISAPRGVTHFWASQKPIAPVRLVVE